MKNAKLRVLMLLMVLFALVGASSGCAYGGVATTQDGRVVVTRNDMFLFGALRAVFVCKVTPEGLASCVQGEAP